MNDSTDQSLTIQGIDFPFKPRYTTGHVLTENEASVLNQTLAENLRNNFAKRVATAKEAEGEDLSEDTLERLGTEFAEYADKYQFGKRQAAAPRTTDPIAREAHKIAKAKITEALRARDIDIKSLPEGKMEEFIKSVLEKKPEIREEAKRRVEAAKSIAAGALDGLDF